jgi:molecular chaperone GrpE
MSATKGTARSRPRAIKPEDAAAAASSGGTSSAGGTGGVGGSHASSGSVGDVGHAPDGAGESTPNRVDPAVIEAFEAELAEVHRQADQARDEAEEARGEASANWDRYLRAEADLDNLRKRSERLHQEALGRQRRDLLGRFLDVADNLERALAHADADPSSLRAGIEGTWRAIGVMLEREGASRIAAEDAEFDPHLHEAVGVVTLPGLAEERIVSVEQAGYTLDGELLRAARVIVGRPAEG